jgi:hypothetical protein
MSTPFARCGTFENVVQVGLGKSGTTTVNYFFTKHLSYNQSCANLDQMRASLDESGGERPMTRTLALCPHFYISELARMYFPQDNDQFQLTHMSAIRRQLGASTLFVHCQRNTSRWVQSAQAWGNLRQRLTTRDMDGLPAGRGGTSTELGEWYEGVNAYLRFAFRWRSNYVRVNVDNVDSLQALFSVCGLSPNSYDFGHENANRCKNIRQTRRIPRQPAQLRSGQ